MVLRRHGTATSFVLIVGLAFAGCISGGPSEPVSRSSTDLGPVLAALDAALVNDHDHSDAALHPGHAWRMREIAFTRLPQRGGEPSAPTEFTIRDGYAYVATFNPSAGFSILDLADPAAPTEVGRFDAGTSFVNDVKISPDGRYAFVATQPDAVVYGLFYQDQFVEAGIVGGGTPFVGDFGVQIVDITDKSAPRLAGVYASGDPNGFHRLDIEEIGGDLFLFGAATGAGFVDISRFDASPVPRLVPVSTYAASSLPGGLPNVVQTNSQTGHGMHDVSVEPDPLEGFPLLVVSYWEEGLHLVDVSDPAEPKRLTAWKDFGEGPGENAHVSQVTAVEGRRIAVVVPETPGGADEQDRAYILDVTDFAEPVLASTWSTPGVHPFDGGFGFAMNRPEIRDGFLFLTHFHAGAYVLDIGTLEKVSAPELRGYVIPPGVEHIQWLFATASPLVYDGIPSDDFRYYYLTDLTGGFRVVEMDPAVTARP